MAASVILKKKGITRQSTARCTKTIWRQYWLHIINFCIRICCSIVSKCLFQEQDSERKTVIQKRQGAIHPERQKDQQADRMKDQLTNCLTCRLTDWKTDRETDSGERVCTILLFRRDTPIMRFPKNQWKYK